MGCFPFIQPANGNWIIHLLSVDFQYGNVRDAQCKNLLRIGNHGVLDFGLTKPLFKRLAAGAMGGMQDRFHFLSSSDNSCAMPRST